MPDIPTLPLSEAEWVQLLGVIPSEAKDLPFQTSALAKLQPGVGWRELHRVAEASVSYVYVLSGTEVRVVQYAEKLGLSVEPLCR
jgi:hypothetical protein